MIVLGPEVFGRLSREVELSWMGLAPNRKDSTEIPSTRQGHSEKLAVWNPEEGLHRRPDLSIPPPVSERWSFSLGLFSKFHLLSFKEGSCASSLIHDPANTTRVRKLFRDYSSVFVSKSLMGSPHFFPDKIFNLSSILSVFLCKSALPGRERLCRKHFQQQNKDIIEANANSEDKWRREAWSSLAYFIQNQKVHESLPSTASRRARVTGG